MNFILLFRHYGLQIRRLTLSHCFSLSSSHSVIVRLWKLGRAVAKQVFSVLTFTSKHNIRIFRMYKVRKFGWVIIFVGSENTMLKVHNTRLRMLGILISIEKQIKVSYLGKRVIKSNVK